MSAERVAHLNQEILRLSAQLVDELAGGSVAPSNDAPPWLTIQGFAARLQMSTKSVRRLNAAGMPHERPRPRAVRIPVERAEAWIAAAPGRAAHLDADAGDVR